MSSDSTSRRSDDLTSHIDEARRAFAEAAAPVLRDLERAGVNVAGIKELEQQRQHQAAAAPVLLRWLSRVSYFPLQSEIVGVLRNMRGSLVAAGLVAAFEQPDAEAIRWNLGDAIAKVADDSIFDGVVRLVRQTSYGKDREMLAFAFTRMDRTHAVPVLLQLLDDDVMVAHAAAALRKLAPPEAREKLEALKNHPRPLVRNNAAKALAAIDNAEAKAASKPAAKSAAKSALKPTVEDAGETAEASTGFDLEQVEPFLKRLGTVVTGFGATQVAQVVRTMDDLEVDDESNLEFEVKYRGLTVPLNIGIFMDDEGAPDLYFSTTTDLAARIRTLIEAFLEEYEDKS
jgi:HEAT repeat protein